MILVGTKIRTAIREAIKATISPIPVYSVIPSSKVLSYVYIENLSQTSIDEKRAFITQGDIGISIVEKFPERDGDFDKINITAEKILAILSPDRLFSFGNLNGIDIFTMHVVDVSESLFDSEPGRTAILTIRLRFMAQKN